MVILGDFPYSALFGLAGYVMTTGVGVEFDLFPSGKRTNEKDGSIGGKF